MDEQHLKGFEATDLSKYFDRYGMEKFVQRTLRQIGFNTAGDLLAFDRVELLALLSRESRKVQERGLTLYDLLQGQKDKIVARKEKNIERKQGSQTPIPPLQPRLYPAPPPSPMLGTDSEAPPEASPAPKDPTTDASPEYPPVSASTPTPDELPPIRLGEVVSRDKFQTERRMGYKELPFTEEGLRRHVLIAGSTGSGKTVAARYIIEQAAISGVPSIVIDAQGDISSLILETFTDTSLLYEHASNLTEPHTPREAHDLRTRIEKHVEALKKHPGPLAQLYGERCLPRIFTPGRPDVGLPLSLPPYLDVLAAYGGDSADEFEQRELDELLHDELRNLVRSTYFPRVSDQTALGYEELLLHLFKHAHSKEITLEGRRGIQNLHALAQQGPELAPGLFRGYLTDKDHQKLLNALYALQFHQEQRWLEGHSLDITALCYPGADGRTPINILNVQELHSADDRKRVLRQVIAAVYKFGVQRPRHSGPPSLVLYIDEIGTGYGERSVGKPDRTATYQVYKALNRLVRQARKYGVAVMLASQDYTDFQPDLRRQLGTKIIGKVDDRSEQHRVAQSIAEYPSGDPIPRIRRHARRGSALDGSGSGLILGG
jgi:hypothetical protein